MVKITKILRKPKRADFALILIELKIILLTNWNTGNVQSTFYYWLKLLFQNTDLFFSSSNKTTLTKRTRFLTSFQLKHAAF